MPNIDGKYLYVNPNDPDGPLVTRQRLYQIRHYAKGICIICTAPRAADNKQYCDRHREYNRILVNKYYHRRKEQNNDK